MSLIADSEVPEDGPIICTITGDAGMGKTRLAAAFPKPYFIRVEDGMKSIPRKERPPASPLVTDVETLWEYLTAMIKEKHDYRTLVIDSTTALDTLFTDYIVATDKNKPKSINQANGGYGAGFTALSALHGRVRKAAGVLNDRRGMHIVFIAHAETVTIELPDQDPYTRYDLRIHKKSITHYVDNVDLVGHIKLQIFTKGEGERKKAISDNTRLLVCHAQASQISKNRFGITEEMFVPEGENPLVDYIDSLKEAKPKRTAPKKEDAKPDEDKQEETVVEQFNKLETEGPTE